MNLYKWAFENKLIVRIDFDGGIFRSCIADNTAYKKKGVLYRNASLGLGASPALSLLELIKSLKGKRLKVGKVWISPPENLKLDPYMTTEHF